jgi:hypothetical protein
MKTAAAMPLLMQPGFENHITSAAFPAYRMQPILTENMLVSSLSS